MGEEGGECPLSPVSIGLGSYKIVSTASWPSCCWAGHLGSSWSMTGGQGPRSGEVRGQGGPKKCLMYILALHSPQAEGFQKA